MEVKIHSTLAARGKSLAGRVTAKRGRILGDDDVAMLIHCEESTTTKTAPFRRNPLGARGFGPQALSFVGHDEKTSFLSLLRTCNPKTPTRGPRDFCHGLLGVSAMRHPQTHHQAKRLFQANQTSQTYSGCISAGRQTRMGPRNDTRTDCTAV